MYMCYTIAHVHTSYIHSGTLLVYSVYVLVSFSDLGEGAGVPKLFVFVPSGCLKDSNLWIVAHAGGGGHSPMLFTTAVS